MNIKTSLFERTLISPLWFKITFSVDAVSRKINNAILYWDILGNHGEPPNFVSLSLAVSVIAVAAGDGIHGPGTKCK